MKATTQAHQAYQEIRRQILTTQLAPHERLKEDAWARRLQVSRMAVREALTRLLGEGLVTPGTRGGYFVVQMDAEDLGQIRQVREILETAAVQLAAARITPAELDELDATCDDFSRMVARGYLAGACEADLHFHEQLLRASGNRRLLTAYHHAHIPLFHLKLGQTRHHLDDFALTDQEHRAVVTALRARNGDQAVAVLRHHFGRGEQALLGP